MLFQELTVPTSGTQGDLGQQSILAADSLDNFQQALNQQVSSSLTSFIICGSLHLDRDYQISMKWFNHERYNDMY